MLIGPSFTSAAQQVLFKLHNKQREISPVLLFDVSEDLNMLSSNLFAISKQVPGAGIQEALISHV